MKIVRNKTRNLTLSDFDDAHVEKLRKLCFDFTGRRSITAFIRILADNGEVSETDSGEIILTVRTPPE